jgi:hypothetical protein
MRANSSTRIRKSHEPVAARDLVDDFDSKRLSIPPHQREYRWDIGRQRKFIQSILKGYPIPSMLMSQESLVDQTLHIEDGRQRITTLSRYRNDMFDLQWPPNSCMFRKYSQLSDDERATFDHTPILIWKFSGATAADRIEIFDFHQNGAPLTPGERYHAQHSSPLVSFVKELLMTPGKGYHDRAVAIWGERGDPVVVPDDFISKDKRRKWLLDATAFVLGLLYGPANATKKYEPDRGLITMEISNAKKASVKKDLERILEIYEAVNALVPPKSPKKWLKTHWDLGNFSGYILYSLSAAAREAHEVTQSRLDEAERHDFEDGFYKPNSLQDKPDKWEHIKNTWVKYMADVRTTLQDNPTRTLKSVLMRKIHANLSDARSWTNDRWDDGYRRVFGLEMEFRVTRSMNPSSESEESDSSEE